MSASQYVTNVSQLRWDRADLAGYRAFTGSFLQPINADLIKLESNKENNTASNLNIETIDNIYGKIVDLLRSSSDRMVPKYKKNFFKYWWDHSLDELKQKSVASCRAWRAAGNPRSGPIFDVYRKDKLAYRHEIRSRQLDAKSHYTNDLHEGPPSGSAGTPNSEILNVVLIMLMV